MFIKFNFWRAIFIFCLVCSMATFALADTIRLKNGSFIKGKIVSFEGGKFTVLIDDGARQKRLVYSADEVESIAFDSTSTLPSNSNDTGNGNTLKSSPNVTKEGNTTIITVGQSAPVNNSANNSANNNSSTTNSPRVVVENNAPTSDNNPPRTSTPSGTPNTSQNTSNNTPQNVSQNTSKAANKPITIRIPVLADNTTNGWTNSGWVVKKGQKIRIKGGGRISLGSGRYATPSGISSLPDNDKLIQSRPTGALIAVIGADNNDFIYIGDSTEFIAARDGDLFLGINEGNLRDNSGSFDATIEIDPNFSN